MERGASSEHDELRRQVRTLEARNDELGRMLAAAYARIDELEAARRLRPAVARVDAFGRRLVRTRAPRLARLYRDLRVRLG